MHLNGLETYEMRKQTYENEENAHQTMENKTSEE